MDWNLPNKLTMARICIIPIFLIVLLGGPSGGVMSLQTARYIAVGLFALASFTDFLDGYIARKNNLITNFGKFMDPIADKLLVAAALVAMVELGDLGAAPVIIIICREFIISGFRLVASDSGVVIAAGYWGKAKTVCQMAMIILVLLALPSTIYQTICDILVITSVCLTVISVVEYMWVNRGVLKSKKS